MKAIIVTGTPGTGKTTFSKKLARKLNLLYFDVNGFILRHKLYEGYDRERRTRVVDISKLSRKLVSIIGGFKKSNKKYGGIVIDSHLSHYIPKKYVDLCIVTKCGIAQLSKRLKKKRYHKSKVQENIQAEIFDVCLNEAKERKHKILVVDTAKGFNIDKIIRRIGG